MKGKLVNQISENGKKTNFGLILAHLAQIFLMSFTSTGCWTLSQAIIVCKFKENVWSKLKKMKSSFWAWFRSVGPKIGPPNFYFKNLASTVTLYHGQLSSCTISEKINDPILRKLSDRRIDGQKDRRAWKILWDAVRLASSVQNLTPH